jgi:predicted metallo-beta-lactamase superfamily hydrolase
MNISMNVNINSSIGSGSAQHLLALFFHIHHQSHFDPQNSFRFDAFLVVPSPAFPHGLEESDAVRCCAVNVRYL